MKQAFGECYSRFGSLHSGNCIAGSGFAPAPSMDWFDKFVMGFRATYESKPFAKLSELFEHHQIETFAQYEEVYELFNQIQVAVPGSFRLTTSS